MSPVVVVAVVVPFMFASLATVVGRWSDAVVLLLVVVQVNNAVNGGTII